MNKKVKCANSAVKGHNDKNGESRLYFASDYMEGAHPAIMKKLMETNLEKTVGYGQDPYTEDAKEKIRKACNAPEANVFLLVGGTQTNATVIDALLKSYQVILQLMNRAPLNLVDIRF